MSPLIHFFDEISVLDQGKGRDSYLVVGFIFYVLKAFKVQFSSNWSILAKGINLSRREAATGHRSLKRGLAGLNMIPVEVVPARAVKDISLERDMVTALTKQL
ncbi:hypothetical protein Droror1_Dr00023298 [Drosera rotundifolia]